MRSARALPQTPYLPLVTPPACSQAVRTKPCAIGHGERHGGSHGTSLVRPMIRDPQDQRYSFISAKLERIPGRLASILQVADICAKSKADAGAYGGNDNIVAGEISDPHAAH